MAGGPGGTGDAIAAGPTAVLAIGSGQDFDLFCANFDVQILSWNSKFWQNFASLLEVGGLSTSKFWENFALRTGPSSRQLELPASLSCAAAAREDVAREHESPSTQKCHTLASGRHRWCSRELLRGPGCACDVERWVFCVSNPSYLSGLGYWWSYTGQRGYSRASGMSRKSYYPLE